MPGSAKPGRPRANLQRDRLTAGYRARLGRAFYMFSCWHYGRSGRSVSGLLHDVAALNGALVEFAQACYDSGKAEWLPRYAILFCQTQNRSLKGMLKPAWDSIAAWKTIEPSQMRLPMRLEVVRALAYFGILAGLMLEPSRYWEWLSFGICLRVGFFGLLRPGELLDIQRSHLQLPSPGMFQTLQMALISIPNPKNRAFAARQQMRRVKDRATVAWLCWYIRGLPRSSALWPFGRCRFCSLLGQALGFFGMSQLGFSVGSLRAGGATWMLETGHSLADIQFAGGWSNPRTLSHYVQEATSAMTLLSLEPHLLRRLEACLGLLDFLEFPPSVTAHVLHETWTHLRQRHC